MTQSPYRLQVRRSTTPSLAFGLAVALGIVLIPLFQSLRISTTVSVPLAVLIGLASVQLISFITSAAT